MKDLLTAHLLKTSSSCCLDDEEDLERVVQNVLDFITQQGLVKPTSFKRNGTLSRMAGNIAPAFIIVGVKDPNPPSLEEVAGMSVKLADMIQTLIEKG